MSNKVKFTILTVLLLCLLLPTSAFATYGHSSKQQSNWFENDLISIFYSDSFYDDHRDNDKKGFWNDSKYKKDKWDDYEKDSYKLWKKYYCW